MSPSQARTESVARQAPPAGPPSLHEARRFCARLTRSHYENFPVAPLLLPARVRPAVQAIYAFARVADDFADEPVHEGRRLQRLDEWSAMLERCVGGEAFHPVFIALRDAIRRHGLPVEPLRDLLRAFRQDVEVRRYDDREALLGYCRLSANPVGRLILHLFGHTEERLLRWSDAVCTALQLANHWQDVGVDLSRDRIYLPLEDRERHGVTEEMLRTGTGPAVASLMRDMASFARGWFEAGRPLCDAVRGRLRLELRLTWHGGMRVLERIDLAAGDVLARRPRLGAKDALIVLGRAVRWTA